MNDLQIAPRLLGPSIAAGLESFPVVVITGARQTGKTTLARSLEPADRRPFRTLDDLRVLEQAEREPDLLVREAERMTLDEVQRVPDLLRAVKRAVDEERRPGRFLLTGSANLLLMRAVSESLAGRAIYFRLGPLTEWEKRAETGPTPWDRLASAGDVEEARRAFGAGPAASGSWQAAALAGGFPPALRLTTTDRARWFDGYVMTYLERDLQQLSQIDSLADFRRLLQIAALRLGGLVNQADMARDAGLSRPTAHRYLNLLQISYQVRLLHPYAVSRTKRLVKSPKLYWTDSGLAAHLAGITDLADPGGPPGAGAFLETLVLSHIDAWREAVTPRPEVLFWRTADGVEVDLVLEWPRRLIPIEVKAASRLRRADIGGIERFLAEYEQARFGLVAYTGDDVYLVTPRVLAVPVQRLL